MDQKIFKAYDIRGLAPGQLDADTAYRVGQALVKFSGAKAVVVGRDMRATSPELFEALARGVNSLGADVIDIGQVTTPMLYFTVGAYDLHDAGAMITASHNPKEYNGIKLCLGDASPIGATTGMAEIRDLAAAGPYPEVGEPGTIVETDIRSDYLDRLFEAVEPQYLAKLKVVTDTGNGMEGAIIKDLLDRCRRVTYKTLCLEPNGNFPNHEANPLKEETLVMLAERVRREGADVGFAFDGDGDRIGVVDERGEVVRGDLLTALLSAELLPAEPGATVLYDVRSSMATAEAIAAAGGNPVMCPVGHGLIKPLLRQTGAIFGGELSLHFYFRDLYGCESSDVAMLLIMAMMSRLKKPLSEIVAPLRRYHHSGEINSEVADPSLVFARLRESYGHEAATETTIDGLRYDFRDAVRPEEDWWFSVRSSNTEPLLRLNLEAKSRTKMESKQEELLGLIRA